MVYEIITTLLGSLSSSIYSKQNQGPFFFIAQFMARQPTPRNKALLRAYENPLVSLNKAGY